MALINMRLNRKLGRIKVPLTRDENYETPIHKRRANKAYKLRQAKFGIKSHCIYADDNLWQLIQGIKDAYKAGVTIYAFGNTIWDTKRANG